MGTVNNNYAVLLSGSFYTGETYFRGETQRQYDWYQWRDYRRDNIDGDGLSRYQLWKKSDPGDWRRQEEYNLEEMAAGLERLQRKYKADEDRREAAERREREREQEARAASQGNGRNGRKWN